MSHFARSLSFRTMAIERVQPYRHTTMTSWIALLMYAGWTLGLLMTIVALRTYLTLTRQRAPNRFSVSGDDVSPFSGRLCRAHANCFENLPVAGALILVAAMTGHQDITNGTALPLVFARIGQSTVHLASTSNRAVAIRFAFLLAQLAIAAYWVIALGLALSS